MTISSSSTSSSASSSPPINTFIIAGLNPLMSATPFRSASTGTVWKLASQVPIHDLRASVVPSLGINPRNRIMIRLPKRLRPSFYLHDLAEAASNCISENTKSRLTISSRGTRCFTASGRSRPTNTACRSVFIPHRLLTIDHALAPSPASSRSVMISGLAENVMKGFEKGGLASCASVMESATAGRMGKGLVLLRESTGV